MLLPSIAERVTKFKIRAEVTATNADMPEGFDPNGTAWKITLRSAVTRRQMTIPFFMGSALTEDPTAEDALNAIKIDAESFYHSSGYADFCEEFGIEEDEASEKTYKACWKTYNRLCLFLGNRNAHDLIMDTESQ